MADQPQPGTHEPVQPKDATILIVEDNVSNFVLMARMLAYMGVPRCEWKTSGYEVMEYADGLSHLDLILMDLGLPVLMGTPADISPSVAPPQARKVNIVSGCGDLSACLPPMKYPAAK